MDHLKKEMYILGSKAGVLKTSKPFKTKTLSTRYAATGFSFLPVPLGSCFGIIFFS